MYVRQLISRGIFCFLLFVLGAVAYGVTSDSGSSEPRRVVEDYLRLDADGAWLTENGRNTLGRLMTLGIELVHEISPYIITGYEIVGVELSNSDEAIVRVRYWLIGESENFVTYVENVHTETVEFHLAKDGKDWKIASYLPPYMAWTVVIAEMKRKREQAIAKADTIKDPQKKDEYEQRLKGYLERIDRAIKKVERTGRAQERARERRVK